MQKNKVFFIYLMIFFQVSGYSQKIFHGIQASSIIPGASSLKINSFSGKPDFIVLNSTSKITESSFENWITNSLKILPEEEFIPFRKEKDQLGFTHIRYQLYYKNIPVKSAVFIGHFDSTGYLRSVNGFYRDASGFDSSSNLSEKEALSAAVSHVHAEKYKWEEEGSEKFLKKITENPDATYYPKGELIYFPDDGNFKSGNFKLSYQFDIYASQPLKRVYIYVDASNGKILREVNRIHTFDSTGTGVTKFSGTQTIIADKNGSTFRLREAGRGGGIETYNLQTGTSYFSAVDFTDSDNYWNNFNANQDEIATDTHWGAEMTYDYYFNTFGRNSFDNAAAKIFSYVHYDYQFANAFWDGTSMTFGDGDGFYYAPLTTVDIVGHEFTHGVTEYSAGLDYWSESGALNESFSDIFGTVVEFYAKPSTANFLLGEEMMLMGGAIRSMENPNLYQCPDTYEGDYWDPSEEVHTNSGVGSYWFYLLAMGGSGTNDIGNSYSVTGQGIDKAAKIAYRTLTVYLTPSSNYNDARTYAAQAAADLFGACSNEVTATENAWYAVGVGGVSSNITAANFSSNTTYSCALPVTINFTNLSSNANNYIWSFGDGGTSTQTSPSHTYTSAGTYNVQLIASGSGSCGSGSDTLVKNSYITITNNGGPVAASCQPATLYPGYAGIQNVSFNTINNTSSISDGYKDYTCQYQTNVIYNNMYSISIETGSVYEENVIVWIDFNNNGVFTSDEMVFSSANQVQYHAGNITIPASSVLSNPLRMRIGSELSFVGNVSPCVNSQYGQFEDYTVTVLPNTIPPVGNFLHTINNSCQGIVQFNDLSLYNPTSWQWNFGDNSAISNSQNPTHVFTAPGTYTITLTVTNAFGSDVYISTITVNPLFVDFISPDTAFTETSTAFTDNSVGAISWQWNFGNGYGSSLQNTHHSYLQEGTYTVELKITGSNGCINQKTKQITIINTTGFNEIGENHSKFRIYPNPNNGNFFIETPGNRIQKIELLNILGEKVSEYDFLFKGEQMMNAEIKTHLSSGLYFLKISTGTEQFTEKIIVE